MLLKIERYTKDQDWWILDDIRKISKAQFKQPFSKDFSDDEANILILDYDNYLQEQGAGQDSRDVIRLVCRLSNDSEFTILFDTIAYLLNDGGKTIEKLVANYR